MIYVDTSVLVSALTNEARSKVCQSWLGRQNPDELAISDWVVTEFSSALSIKLRSGHLSLEERAECLSSMARLADRSFDVLSVGRDAFRIAAQMADRHELGLRASDALHLGLCAAHGATLATLDRGQRDAAIPMGISASLI